jgi:hypothetical protein
LEAVTSAEDRSARDNDKLVRRCMLVLASSSGTLQQMVAGEVLYETVNEGSLIGCDRCDRPAAIYLVVATADHL